MTNPADEEGCTCECYSDAAFCMKRCIYAGCNPADEERDLLHEAYALLAEYNCVLAISARHVTRAKVKDWLDRTKGIVA